MIFPRDPRDAADLYLQRGLAPIPLLPRSKGEALPGGWQHIRVTPENVEQYFPRGVASNVGILNGVPSNNHLDVDLDCDNALLVASMFLPPTGWTFGRKSARSSHRIYHSNQSLDKACEQFKSPDGTMLLELRSTCSLTVFPPSSHRETGEEIAWESFGDPGEVTLVDLHQRVRELAACALIAHHWPKKGTRDSAAMALAGGLAWAGWEVGRASHFVEAVAIAARDDEVRMRAGKAARTAEKLAAGEQVTGWSALSKALGTNGGEVVFNARTWLGLVSSNSLTTTGTSTPTAAPLARPKPLLPYARFPLECLPAPLDEYARCSAAALGCDPAYVALPLLAVCASLIGTTRSLRIKRSWKEPAVLWTAVVGDSGTLKSPAVSLAVDPVLRLQGQLREQHKQAMQRYATEHDEWEDRKREHKQREKSGTTSTSPGEEPQPPSEPRIVLSDATIEKIAEALEDNPRGLLLWRDELDAWLQSFSRYKGKGGGSDRGQWLEMHGARALLYDRKTGDRRTVFVAHAAVSITGGIQPGVLKTAMTRDARDSGLAARMLLACPPRFAKTWTEEDLPEKIEASYDNLLKQLLTLTHEKDEQGARPWFVCFSDEAKREWVAWYNEWAGKQMRASGDLAAAFAKLEAYSARLALVHHVVSCLSNGADDRRPLGVESMLAAIALTRWFAAESQRIYSMLDETTDESDVRRLLELIQARGGKITTKELQQGNGTKYPTSERAKVALDGLVQSGLGRWEPRPSTGKGGRPTSDFVLDTEAPRLNDETDETPDDGDAFPEGRSDETPDKGPTIPPPTLCFPLENEVSSVSSFRRRDEGETKGLQVNDQSGHEHGVSTTPYLLVTRQEQVADVISALEETVVVAVDTETTGLDACNDRVRLLSICVDTCDGGKYAYLLDLYCLNSAFLPLFEALSSRDLVLHNAVFDLGFLQRLGFEPHGKVYDTLHLSRVLHAGEGHQIKHSLAACAERHLGEVLPKEERLSDWSGPLTESQLAYAARDVLVLPPLLSAIQKKISEARLDLTAEIETRCVPAIAWMAAKGVAVDRQAWSALIQQAQDAAASLKEQMEALAPVRAGEMFARWNWDSPQDMKQLFSELGFILESTDDDHLAGVAHPMADLLRQYREATKRTGTYGEEWLKNVRGDGRVYASWKQTGSEAGRMSCSEPNMQQLPRDNAYRRCVAAPEGRVLVKADYSQIELRIAAKVSKDAAMLEAYQKGEDLHVKTARSVLGKEDVTKNDRQIAKSLNFGLLYGMGAKGFLQYAKSTFGVNLTLEEAERYRKAFFDTYPGLKTWHRKAGGPKEELTETRTLAGRRRLKVKAFTWKLNTPVQGTGADGLKMALALLWERRCQAPNAFPVLAVHDEIVVECDKGDSEQVADWLKGAMIKAMSRLIDPVPVEVDVKIAPTWGG